MARSFLIMALLLAAVAINVGAAATTMAAPSPSPTPSLASPPTSSPVMYLVGYNEGAFGWTNPAFNYDGPEVYQNWAANKQFKVGDKLVFHYVTDYHNVAQVNKNAYDSCDTNSAPLAMYSTSPTSITLITPGEYFFICTYHDHCIDGQKLAINVTGVASSPSTFSQSPSSFPRPARHSAHLPPPTPSPISGPTSSPVTYVVGDALGWTVPAVVGANPKAYQIWATNKSFKVGDKLVFNYVAGRHSVAQVNKEAYNSCDSNSTTFLRYSTSPTSITLNSPGEYFFICTYPDHCANGQKLAINVNDVVSSPTISSAGTSSSQSPSGDSLPFHPPARNSATSLGVVSVCATFLSIFVALFLC